MSSAVAFPSWVMLEPFVFRRDREESFRDETKAFPDESKAPVSLSGTTSWGAPFDLAFSLAEPPLTSRLYAHLPDFPKKQRPVAVIATHRHLALLRLGIKDPVIVQDFFIYNASADSPSSALIELLPCTEPPMDYIDNCMLPCRRSSFSEGALSTHPPKQRASALSSHPPKQRTSASANHPPKLRASASASHPPKQRASASHPPKQRASAKRRLMAVISMGILCRGGQEEEEEEEFVVAELKLFKPSLTNVFADIYLFKSSAGEWDSMRVPILHSDDPDDTLQLVFWQTDTVITVGPWLCWVDYYRGILFCDPFREPTPTVSFLRFPLDNFPDSYDRDTACSWLYRVVSAINAGRELKFVDVARYDGIGPLKPGAGGFTITCHTLALHNTAVWNKKTLGSKVWNKDCVVTSNGLWSANPPNRLPRQILMFPQVDIHKPHVVHFLISEFGRAMKKMWLVAIDINTRNVESFSQYINGEDDIGTECEGLTEARSMCPMPFLPCEFSGYIRHVFPRKRREKKNEPEEDDDFLKCITI